MLNQLLNAAPGEDARIVGALMTEWSKSGSAAVDLLFTRGQSALDAQQYRLAAEHFTAAIDYAPDFAESYHARATAYYRQGLVGPALGDLSRTLQLNANHFGAMQGLAVILQEIGKDDDALAVFQAALAIHPSNGDITAAIERLLAAQIGQAL
ncbi:MAG: tetratricopeptide repeat protein [Rhodobacteraceae bacterium]|nr:tetratricopeptide repeat protein [Paracoccaceae bacterium]